MALRFWPEGTAVGRRFRLAEWDGVEYEVVGVSSDYKVRFPTEEPASYLHLAASQRLRTGAVILARTRGDAAALSADIRRELRGMEPDLFFFLQGDTLRETADVAMLPFRIGASVASASGIVAMVLGAIGLYGVIAYLVAGRTREFAIRAALGARSGALLRLVLATEHGSSRSVSLPAPPGPSSRHGSSHRPPAGSRRRTRWCGAASFCCSSPSARWRSRGRPVAWSSSTCRVTCAWIDESGTPDGNALPEGSAGGNRFAPKPGVTNPRSQAFYRCEHIG